MSLFVCERESEEKKKDGKMDRNRERKKQGNKQGLTEGGFNLVGLRCRCPKFCYSGSHSGDASIF